MKDQPKPASGEWTVEMVSDFMQGMDIITGYRLLAKMHNAALAAERDELELERMRHAACGVIAMSNTPESLAKNRDMKPEFLSASVQDCIRAIERELQLRKQLAAAVEALTILRNGANSGLDRKVADAALAKIDQKNWIRAEDNPGFHRHE